MYPLAGEKSMSSGLNILVLKVGKLANTWNDGMWTILKAFGFLSEAIARISDVGLNFTFVTAVTRFNIVFTGVGLLSLRTAFVS